MQPSYKVQADASKNKEPVTTEYREEINKTGKQIHATKASKRSEKNDNLGTNTQQDKRLVPKYSMLSSNFTHKIP